MSIEKKFENQKPFSHQSVLLTQCIEGLNVIDGGVYVDATLGGGGHALSILESAKSVRLYGIDRDPQAMNAAQNRLSSYHEQCTFFLGTFADHISEISEPIDGILFDLGVSSPQLDQAHRGFSFSKSGPLDMRMNQQTGPSASDIINNSTEKELASIIFHFGEERRSRRIAKAICAQRPFLDTLALAECVRISSGYKQSRNHPATRTFQALRIAVNQELKQIEDALPKALSLLKPNGRLAVISFHSLEDRIVKRFFQNVTGKNTPKDAYGNPMDPPQALPICYKGITGKKEDPLNPRARSARLRIISKIPAPIS
jgi:16S rRNA (cytosine1402-N4)-methyltransferase